MLETAAAESRVSEAVQ